MKNVILSADGDSVVYSVPDAVADHLEEYCMEFCTDWIWHSPDAEKYRQGKYVCYTQSDFIDYLNRFIFQNEQSAEVENLGWTNLGENLPDAYRGLPYFNF